jgi:hypothetical protein
MKPPFIVLAGCPPFAVLDDTLYCTIHSSDEMNHVGREIAESGG